MPNATCNHRNSEFISTQSDGKVHFAIEELQTCQPKDSMSRKLTCRFSSLEVIDHQTTQHHEQHCSSQGHPPSQSVFKDKVHLKLARSGRRALKKSRRFPCSEEGGPLSLQHVQNIIVILG